MRALDLYCGAGGAGYGLFLAGYQVLGVDKVASPRHPSELDFLQENVLNLSPEWIHENFDLVWASPPCQGYSQLSHLGTHWCTDRLIADTRRLLHAADLPYVMENVMGARSELAGPPSTIMLCGHMADFQLRTYRHRLFECVPFLPQPLHRPHKVKSQQPSIANYDPSKFVSVYGSAGNADLCREILEVPWMSGRESSQCVPPTYSRWIGRTMADIMGWTLTPPTATQWEVPEVIAA